MIPDSRRWRAHALVPFLLCSVLAGAGARIGATAQALPQSDGGAAPTGDELASERGTTPRRALREYLDAANARRFEEAARYLNLNRIPESDREIEGARLAEHLKVVLDRTHWIDLESISDDARGDLGDGLADDLERVATIPDAGSVPFDVLMRRVDDPAGGVAWRFAASTVARVPALYEQYGYGVLEELLPESFFTIRFLELQLWQWLGLMTLVLLAFAASWVVIWAGYRAVKPAIERSATDLDDTLVELLLKPLRLALALALFSVGVLALRVSAHAQQFFVNAEKGLAILVFAWILIRLTTVATRVVRGRLEREGKRAAVAALPLGEKAIKVVLLAFAAVAMLQNLGFNVTGVIAGLGIGGLALALAAQKTVENLFGGVSLIVDQPVRVGDFCRYGDKVGTIEDIGLRSTRVRSLDRTLVSVPNAEFAQRELESFASRDKILFKTTLGLRYETSADQLRLVLAETRRLLAAHARVDPDPARVRFVGYGESGLQLEVFAYVRTSDFGEYLGIQEDLLLRIMDIVQSAGAGFAFPSQTVYLARDRQGDPELVRQAEARVRLWREQGKLPFPDFDPSEIAAIDDSISFPSPRA